MVFTPKRKRVGLKSYGPAFVFHVFHSITWDLGLVGVTHCCRMLPAFSSHDLFQDVGCGAHVLAQWGWYLRGHYRRLRPGGMPMPNTLQVVIKIEGNWPYQQHDLWI